MAEQVKVAVVPACDICVYENVAEPEPAAYDGRTIDGPWAYMCEAHWQSHGVGRLGTGYGQRLILERMSGS